MERASPAFRWILYHWAVGKPLHPLLLLKCLCCYFETSPRTMILKSYDKDLWGPHWGMETLLLFLICEWNVDTYDSMIPGENHCFYFKLLHVWRLIPIVLCQPVHTLKTPLDFWPLKKKEQLVFLFWGFVFLSCHHLLCLVCPFLDTHAEFWPLPVHIPTISSLHSEADHMEVVSSAVVWFICRIWKLGACGLI